MKIIYPDYYKSFKCVAGECIDTCCAGWEVVVDSASAQKYKNVDGAFGEKLRSAMTVDADGDTIFAPVNGRCPFLNNKNLCEIYINCGENHLCHTCTMFPRFVEEFGSLREIGLGFGCPEAVRIILSQKEKWKFVSENTDELPEPNDIDADLYFALTAMRKKLFELIFNKDFSFDVCLANAVEFTDECQQFIDDEEYEKSVDLCENFVVNKLTKTELFYEECSEILNKLEVLSDNWKPTLSKVDFKSEVSYSDDFRNISAYYIYRYFLKAVYDYDAITPVRFCALSCEIISRLQNAGIPLETAVRIYSKEAEYSAENLEMIYEYL
ncbi:MAG: flagellin lysine-N-methylase [Clostridia bacterium]|nr:flagellin lysine-N-methylase [Clostridia bacterium]